MQHKKELANNSYKFDTSGRKINNSSSLRNIAFSPSVNYEIKVITQSYITIIIF